MPADNLHRQSMLLGIFPHVGIVLLTIFLITYSLLMHTFWKNDNMMMKIPKMINFQKNMALLGALLMFLAIRAPWYFSL
jgi:putative oxidoreductase